MRSTAEFTIGSEVFSEDGACGELQRVVVDPIKRTLTHLVVAPRHRQNMGHLVPIDLVDTTANSIRLLCTTAQFEALEDAEETRFLPGASGQWAYGPGQILSQPYHGLGASGMGMGGTGMRGLGLGGLGGGMGMGLGDIAQTVTYDKVPIGEVEVRRGEHVHATDGSIGRVRGLIIDPTDYHVTHVLLDEGHLWGQKEVAIPISAVAGVDDGVRLNLTRDEVRDLPPVDIDRQD